MTTPDQAFLFPGRVLAWFSCGTASACATKLAIERFPDRCIPVNCDSTAGEDPDNVRFRADCEKWFGRKIVVIKSAKYSTPDEVFEGESYMTGPYGARCTTELKRKPRHTFARPEDVHVFGFTADESKRISDFEARNPELFLAWVLRDAGITKQGCYKMVTQAGIKLPWMNRHGYPNNNCPGCVKSQSAGYWNKIRIDYPAVFQSRAAISRKLGVRLVQYKGKLIFLDELPPDAKGRWKDEIISCGPECGTPTI